MMVLSLLMIIKPEFWANGIVEFSEKPYFHPFEIISRFSFGIIFVLFAEKTLYPKLITIIRLFTACGQHRTAFYASGKAQTIRIMVGT